MFVCCESAADAAARALMEHAAMNVAVSESFTPAVLRAKHFDMYGVERLGDDHYAVVSYSTARSHWLDGFVIVAWGVDQCSKMVTRSTVVL